MFDCDDKESWAKPTDACSKEADRLPRAPEPVYPITPLPTPARPDHYLPTR